MKSGAPFLFLMVMTGFVGSMTMSCNPVTKLSRSPLVADRDTAAFVMYERGKYANASILFEELLGVYKNTPRAEVILYYYAHSLMQSRNYITAGFYFEQLAQQYPNSKHTQESYYNVGMCHYYQSRTFDLDQTETVKAIDAFQLYLGIYPDTPDADKINKQIADLRERLAQKSFKTTELYFNIGHYKAAVVAAENTVREYPDSKYREEAQFIKFKAQTEYANLSIPTKQPERYQEALKYYGQFVKRYPQSKFLKEAERLKAQIDRQLERLPTFSF